MENSKIIVSYNGGSAGDLFVKSCNGELLGEMNQIHISQPSTLKNYENKIQLGKSVDLTTELNLIPYQFVSTHMLNEIVGKNFDVVSIVMTDVDAQVKTIYRQMQLQNLRILIDKNEASWYTTICKYALKKDYENAAIFWFEKSKEYWLDKMKHRLEFDRAQKINFNSLYTTQFTDNLILQGWNHNTVLLKYNHTMWLEKNHSFSYNQTIQSMIEKISKMDWKQETGWIAHKPLLT